MFRVFEAVEAEALGNVFPPGKPDETRLDRHVVQKSKIRSPHHVLSCQRDKTLRPVMQVKTLRPVLQVKTQSLVLQDKTRRLVLQDRTLRLVLQDNALCLVFQDKTR